MGACVVADETPTYWSDARPVLDTHCMRCHSEDGQGTGDFTDPKVAQAFGAIMLDRVDAREMPPPASDPDCRDYEGSEHLTMPEDAVGVLRRWVEEGTLLGDPNDYLPKPAPSMELADADLELFPPVSFTPTFDAADARGNEYRCFFLEHGRDEAFYITALAPIIDADALVHHIIVGTQSRATMPENYDPNSGIECMNRGTGGESVVGGWAAGNLPVELPSGEGIRIKADELIVLQLHYQDTRPGQALSDRSGYAFRTATEVSKEVVMYPFGPTDFEIPADEVYSASMVQEVPVPVTLYGTMPHMHALGAGYRIWVEHADGSESCVAQSDQFDVHNQLTYMFREPMKLDAGDKVHVECTWDNTTQNDARIHDAPQATTYGERTDEEMCWAFSLLGLGH